jgi:hypothetical protein
MSSDRGTSIRFVQRAIIPDQGSIRDIPKRLALDVSTPSLRVQVEAVAEFL